MPKTGLFDFEGLSLHKRKTVQIKCSHSNTHHVRYRAEKYGYFVNLIIEFVGLQIGFIENWPLFVL
jgi:hypothetical protein